MNKRFIACPVAALGSVAPALASDDPFAPPEGLRLGGPSPIAAASRALRATAAVGDTAYIGHTPGRFDAARNWWSVGAGFSPGASNSPSVQAPIRGPGWDVGLRADRRLVSDPSGESPTDFVGLSNNPLRSGLSVVTFGLAAPDRVEANVFDVAGRLVRQLANRRFAAGEHRIVWDGRDDRGEALPRGVYFTRIRYTERGFVDLKKLTILH